MTTRCRYYTATHTNAPSRNTGIAGKSYEYRSTHICSFCAGAGEYKTSESGKRKVRR